MKNKWGTSFVQLVILVIYFMVAIAFKGFIDGLKTEDTLLSSSYILMFIDFCFYGFFGVIIGMINFVGKRRKRKANVSKVILLVIPSLFFALSMFIYYSSDSITLFDVFDSIIMKATLQGNIVFMYQILFGYLLVYSLEN